MGEGIRNGYLPLVAYIITQSGRQLGYLNLRRFNDQCDLLDRVPITTYNLISTKPLTDSEMD